MKISLGLANPIKDVTYWESPNSNVIVYEILHQYHMLEIFQLSFLIYPSWCF